MLLKRRDGGLHFSLSFSEFGFDLTARELHLAFDLFSSAFQLAFHFPGGLLKFAALLFPCPAEVPPEIFKWIAATTRSA